MEAYPALSADLIHDDNDNNLNNYYVDPTTVTYDSLFQFDLDLQQQALATMPTNPWPDDVFLPTLDDGALFFSASTNPLPPTTGSNQVESNGCGAEANLIPSFDPLPTSLAPSSASMSTAYATAEPSFGAAAPYATPVVMSQWTPESEAAEYVSPENYPFSPPESKDTTAVSCSAPQSAPVPAAYTIPADVPSETHVPSPPMDTAAPTVDAFHSQPNWPPIPSESGPKVPIQRLKAPTTPATPAVSNTAGANGGRQMKKSAHNAIERRYRNNINDRITELKNAVPALLHAKVKDSRTAKRSHRALDDDDEDGDDDEEYLDGVAVATKLNKATILRKATEYINHLKKTGDLMQQENNMLQHLLSQMPGGQDVLSRYRMQKMQREQELQQQRILQRQMSRKQQRKQKAKRTKTHAQTDEYESSSSASAGDPATPPVITQRVFMALFACLTFFSDSPLTTRSSVANLYKDHGPVSHTTGMEGAQTVAADVNATGLLQLLTKSFDSGWQLLRTVAFVLCLSCLLLPIMQSKMNQYAFHVKRVPRTKRMGAVGSGRRSRFASAWTAVSGSTPGDQKRQQMYILLCRALAAERDAPSSHIFPRMIGLIKEAFILATRHGLGFAFVRGQNEHREPEDLWGQACRWVQLCEVVSVNGNPGMSNMARLHVCCRMINLADDLDEQELPHASQLRSRAYLTAALQFSLALPQAALTRRIARYFWQSALSESSMVLELDNQEGSAVYMHALQWVAEQYDLQDEEASEHLTMEHMDLLLEAPAWQETLAVMRSPTDQDLVGLSFTSPVVIPVAILSTLHLMYYLKHQYNGLMEEILLAKQTSNSENNNNNSSSSNSDSNVHGHYRQVSDSTQTDTLTNEFIDHHFAPLLQYMAQSAPMCDAQRVVCWFATVGLVASALWQDHIPTAETHIQRVLERVPRAITAHVPANASREAVNYKQRLNQLDELHKRSMALVLLGATRIKRGNTQEGLDRLYEAERIRTDMKRIMNKKDRRIEPADQGGLEASVTALCECTVAMVGLEAWITAWKQLAATGASEERIQAVRMQVKHNILCVRRMMGRPLIQRSQAVIARLTRLGGYVTNEADDIDSAYDCSDVEGDHTGHSHSTAALDVGGDGEVLASQRATRALHILHGA